MEHYVTINPGGSLPLAAVPYPRPIKNVEKGYVFQGWARNARKAKRMSKSRKCGKKGIYITMIRVLKCVRLYVERVSKSL